MTVMYLGSCRTCIVVSFISLLIFCFSVSCSDIPQENNNNKYSQYLSLVNNKVLFSAPFSGLKNDQNSVSQTELTDGDFLRFPETEESGEILKVLEIQEKFALIEYIRYAAPPASTNQGSYQFKVYKSNPGNYK